MLKTAPAVFVVGEDYQIMVPVSCETVMWVKVGDKCFYDESNGILCSAKRIHRMVVPCEILDKEGKVIKFEEGKEISYKVKIDDEEYVLTSKLAK